MDDAHFDALTRRLRSRRTAFAGLLGTTAVLLGLGTEQTSAHNPVPACKQIKDTKQRLACLRRARAHNRTKHGCKPKPKATFCRNRCGTTQNNCKKKVSCTCPAGKTCLINKGCNRTCFVQGAPGDCPAGCTCAAFLAENPANLQCFAGAPPTSCDQMPLPCVTSANCPRGSFCAEVSAACGTDRCLPNCPY